MYASPCVDHDNCSLDLEKLKAALKAPRWQNRDKLDKIKTRINAANERMKEAYKVAQEKFNRATDGVIGSIRACAGYVTPVTDDPDYRKAAEEHRQAWQAHHDWHYKESDTYWTLLYSIRAHHRGRIHRRRERCGDGSVIEHSLESQAAYIKENRWKVLRLFERKTNQEAV